MEFHDDLAQALGLVYATTWPTDVSSLLFTPSARNHSMNLDEAFDVLDGRIDGGIPDYLIPLAVVDESSIACVAVERPPEGIVPGDVVRLHLNGVSPEHQLRLLDTDPLLFVESVAFELAARGTGLNRVLDEIGPAYQELYIDNEKRPRDFVVRPVRIACQNVIVAIAAIAQDSRFDGLSVVAWQTCEVPHVATHEANRALAALTLSDAFQNGGTMEIRFDREATTVLDGRKIVYPGHPEKDVPASLKRFGRTVGVALGVESPGSISPKEARALFLAITPMPSDLRGRVDEAVAQRGITPERICFTLLAQIWREIELDFMLGCTERAASILEGGEDWRNRSARQAEMEVARAALMAGMLYRRLNGRDSAGNTEGPRVVEDSTLGVRWTLIPEVGAVRFEGVATGTDIPWVRRSPGRLRDQLTVVFRSHVTEATAAQIHAMHDRGEPVAVAIPMDADEPRGMGGVPVLRCPDRTADLDRQVEARLLTARISRG